MYRAAIRMLLPAETEEKPLRLTVWNQTPLAFIIHTGMFRNGAYEMIMDIVWNEECNKYSRKAINNHISNLRKKLKTIPEMPDYIKSVHSVGYKFEM